MFDWSKQTSIPYDTSNGTQDGYGVVWDPVKTTFVFAPVVSMATPKISLHDGYCVVFDVEANQFVEFDITRFGNVLYPLDAVISVPAMNAGQTKFVTVSVPSAKVNDSALVQMQPSTFGNYFVSVATVVSNGTVGLGLIAQAHLPAMMLNAQITIITKQTYSQGLPT